MPSLIDRLRALGVQIEPRPQPVESLHAIERVVPGHWQETPFGPVFVVEKRHTPDRQVSCDALRRGPSPPILAEWAQEPRLRDLGGDDLAYLDVEATGLARGAGTYAFLVGVGGYRDSSFVVRQFFMRDPAQEPALLFALAEYLRSWQGVVTFNGKTFDLPLLKVRYTSVSLEQARSAGASVGEAPGDRGEECWASPDLFPMAGLPHLDLLPLARRLWRERLPSRALGYLEACILGVTRTEEDVSGWMVPGLYLDYVRSGDARPLSRVFYHNEIDVLSMASLLNHMVSLLDDPLGSEVHGVDRVALARLFEDMGHLDMAVRLYRHGLAGDLPSEVYWKAVHRLSFAYKRREDMGRAVDLWQEAAQEGWLYACVELAKFYEHRQRDLVQAMRWTERAVDCVRGVGGSEGERARWLPGLEHRLDRLRAKSARDAYAEPGSVGGAEGQEQGDE